MLDIILLLSVYITRCMNKGSQEKQDVLKDANVEKKQRKQQYSKYQSFYVLIMKILNYIIDFTFRILMIFKIWARKIDSLLYRYWDLSFDRYSDR